MNRRRGALSSHRIEKDANDVLTGRISMGAGELLECIHAINPTGRGLGPADERRRYQLKSRLQSLLIRKFQDDIVVTADTRGVVAIRHRYLGQDACHARIDELDEDARARVRLVLDLGDVHDPEAEGMAMPPSSEVAADESSLARARAALAEFDYETACAHFEHAAVGPSGDPAAARELLELLVDQLALYEQSLALVPRLPERATADPEVRALLAVAASRAGDLATAHRLLDTLTGPRAADAWCALAQAALDRGACDEVERCVARLAACDPAHPEVHRFRDEVTRLRADARSPAEQELLRIAEGGDDAAIEAAARAVLARWPDSPIAGRTLGKLQEQRRRANAERLLAMARAALTDRQVGRTAELCRQARALGAETAGLLDQIREAEAAERRAREDAGVAAVCTQLADGDPRPGLHAYLALEPDQRRRVRDRLAVPMLEWLETAPHRGATVDAILALAAASEALEHDDAARALALLDVHAPLLTGVSRANEVRAAAQHRIAAARRNLTTTTFEQAQRVLAAGDLDLCQRLLDRVDRRDLDSATRPRLDRVLHELQERRDAVRRRARVDELVASGDLVTACRELTSLLAADPGVADRGEAMLAQLDELRRKLRRVWCVRSDDVGRRLDDHDPIGELLGPLPYLGGIASWLLAGGRELVIATANGRHVFLGRVSVDDRQLLERRYLRAPEPLGGLISTTIDGDTLWLAGESGHVLQVSWSTGEPVRWSSLGPLLDDRERVERVFQLPGATHLWLETGAPGSLPSDRVIEIESWRVRRRLPASRGFQKLVAGSSSCVVGTGYKRDAVIYTERGTVAEPLTACAGMRVSTVTTDPRGKLVVLGARSGGDDDNDDDDNDGGGTVELMQLADGRAVRCEVLPDSHVERALQAASARGPDRLFVHHALDLGVARLVTFRVAEPGLELVHSVAAPSHVVLVQDAEADQLVCLWDSARRVELTRLGVETPAFDDAVEVAARSILPALARYFACLPHPEPTHAPAVGGLDAADAAACRGDWSEVRARLEPVPLDEVEPHEIAHHCHLLGIALLRTGAAAARVHEIWSAGLRHDVSEERYSSCKLDRCLELIEPLPDPLPDAWWGDGATLIRQLRGAIATADRCLAANDASAALEALRCRAVSKTGETQSAARLAAAWLASEPHGAAACFDKAIALSRFVEIAAHGKLDLPALEAWNQDRLSAVADQAERWLAGWLEDGTGASPARRTSPQVHATA
jgi:hypothetical protein